MTVYIIRKANYNQSLFETRETTNIKEVKVISDGSNLYVYICMWYLLNTDSYY